jgi:hypothetical protein
MAELTMWQLAMKTPIGKDWIAVSTFATLGCRRRLPNLLLASLVRLTRIDQFGFYVAPAVHAQYRQAVAKV